MVPLRGTDCLPRVLGTLSTSEEVWKTIDEAGEFYAALMIAQSQTGEVVAARQTLERARLNVDSSWTAARIFLELSEAILEHKPLDPFVAWFKEHGFLRAVEFTEKIVAI